MPLLFINDKQLCFFSVGTGESLTMKDTKLMSAVEKGDISTVKRLLEIRSLNVDHQSEKVHGATALMLAASKGQKTIVKLLIEKGAAVNIQNMRGHTALIFAAVIGHENVAKGLIAQGADVNIQDMEGATALIFAADNGHDTIVEDLSLMGADHNMKSRGGHTASTVAAEKGHWNIVKYLDDFRMNPIEELYKKIKKRRNSLIQNLPFKILLTMTVKFLLFKNVHFYV